MPPLQNKTEKNNKNISHHKLEENYTDIMLKNLNQSQGKIIAPNKHDIYKNSPFGKLSKDHSFTSEASFEHCLIHIFKSNYLIAEDTNNLLNCHALFRHLHKMIGWSKNIDFSDIKRHIPDYQDQKSIKTDRVKLFLAALLHYDLDVPTLIRYLGGNYTGEYRNVEDIVAILNEAKCDPTIISDLERIFRIGCPMKMNAFSTKKNFLDFFRYGNHTSIKQNIEKTLNTMSKEDRNQYLIPLPNWLARFIKHLHVTPQGLLIKKDKDDRLIWDGSFIPHWAAMCINMMLNHESEPEIIYGSTFARYLSYLWNFRISRPRSDIMLMDDDVKGAFRHCKYHPDVASAFSFIIQYYLFISLGGTFGSIVTPSNFEPIARARTHLAEYLSTRRDLLQKYAHIIDKVKFSPEQDANTVFTNAVPCSINPGLIDTNRTQYNMFVDDSLFAQTRDNIKHAMAASIEALHIILGYPDTEIRQNPLSLDKYYESTCSFERIQLGIRVNSRTMCLSLTDKKRLSMLDELSHWHSKRKSFTLLQGVTLCGSIEFWANISPWVRFLYLNLRSAVNRCITTSLNLTKEKKAIKEMITKLAHSSDLGNLELKERYIQSRITKETYRCKQKTFITKHMRTELKLIHQILSNPTRYSLDTPIAHVVHRDPEFITFGDASLEAGGGFANDCFWWHTAWSTEIKSLTLKNLTITRRCKLSNDLISINLLEFVVEIINYAAISTLIKDNLVTLAHEYPILLNWTDNKSAQSWIRKAATRTDKGKSLQRILCSLMINNPLGFKADYIKGETNVLADAISRTFVSNSVSFNTLIQKFPQIQSWMRFHPSHELLSHLFSALLTGQDLGLPQIKNLGHFTRDNITL